jgi:dolichol kinase
MNQDILNIIFFSIAFLGLFLITDVIHLKLKVKADITRKITHVLSGLLTLLFPTFFSSHWYVLIICLLFFILLIASKKLSLLPSINKVERTTWGSFLFPVVIYYCFLFYEWQNEPLYFYIPMTIMAVSDTLAEIIGVNLPWLTYKIGRSKKTLSGSLSFAVSAFIISAGILTYSGFDITSSILMGLALSLSTALFEAFSTKGFDNLTVPVVATWILFLFLV